jgi:hypothetical protein
MQLVFIRLVISLKRILKGNDPLVIAKGNLGLLHLCLRKSVHWRLELLLKFFDRLRFSIDFWLNTLNGFSYSAHSLLLYNLSSFLSQTLSFTLSIMNLLQHSFYPNRAILRIVDYLDRLKEVHLKLRFMGRRRIRFLWAILFKSLVVHFNYFYSLTFCY